MTALIDKLPFKQHRWFQFLLFLGRHFIEDNCQQKAASLTYTTMLSIVPIFTVMLVILSSVPALAKAREEFQELIYSNLLPQSSVQVSQYINDFAEKSSNLTAIGIMVLFVTTILTLITIENAFNEIWRVQDNGKGFKSLLHYWAIVTLGPLVLGTAFIVSGAVQSLSFLNQQIAGYGIDWAFWVHMASLVVTIAGFVGMYWFIPKAKVPFRNALIAGVITAILFEMLKQTFGMVMTNFTSYQAIYGAFAALPIFLLWIYLSWNLILLGVEISYTLTIFETKEVYPRHPLLSLLDMLNLVFKKHQQGESVSEQALRDVLGRKELPKWFTYLSYLKNNNLITETEHGNYVLKKDLSSISLWSFYQTLPYPLPIKSELTQLNEQDYDPWYGLLLDKFIQTEAIAKQHLDIPLAQVFAHTPIRDKSNPEDSGTKSDLLADDLVQHAGSPQQTHNDAHLTGDSMAFADVEADAEVIAADTSVQGNAQGNAQHSADSDKPATDQPATSKPAASKIAAGSTLLAYLHDRGLPAKLKRTWQQIRQRLANH